MFCVSNIAPNAPIGVYGILFGGIHPPEVCLYNILISLYILKQKRFKKNGYLKDNGIYTFSIKLSFFKYRTRQIKTIETNKQTTHLNRNGCLCIYHNVICNVSYVRFHYIC